jgi:uncharacterized cofD-like protein
MKAVAIGGGHGTAVTLRALRGLTNSVTGIVSVADNGGSTGRLREILDVAAVGDLRKCLLALAGVRNPLAPYLEHRFRAGELEGHTIGNLLLAGLIDATGDLEFSVRSMGELLKITGAVVPASTEGVVLVARTDQGRAEGQTEVAASATIRRVATEPEGVRAPDSATRAIAEADLVVIGPGSLYTSVLAACVVPGMTEALAASTATKVLVANLREQVPETQGYALSDHVTALRRHGIGLDLVLADVASTLPRGDVHGRVVEARVSRDDARVHDPERLALCLSQLVA